MRKVFTFLSVLLSLNCTIFAQNNVGIGTTTPHSSARLDITATDKGILIPRVSLTSIATAAPVVGAAEGILVWNSNASFPGGKGFYFWDGASWRPLLNNQSGWTLNGNSGTATSNFIGTADDVPLAFRVNNIKSGMIDHLNNNVFLGFSAGSNNTPNPSFGHGARNTFLGDHAGDSNTTGLANTYVGAYAGTHTTGLIFNNSFFGAGSGQNNRTGGSNSFFGASSGFSNNSGVLNSFFGSGAGQSNVDGSLNSYFGRNSGSNPVSGDQNSFFGAQSGGGGGTNNSGLGDSSGFTLQTNAAENTFLGFRATSLGLISNSTAVGARARTNCSDCIVLGSVDGINGANSSVSVGIGLTNPSRPLHVSGSATTTGVIPHSDAVVVVEKDGDNAFINILTDSDRGSGIGFGNQLNSLDGGIYYNLGGNAYDLRFRTNRNITRMLLDSIGRLGIGTTSPDFQLELSQNSAAKPTSSAWTVPSDLRLKENIYSFQDGLSILEQINPVWFTYNGEAGLPKETGVGTIAQELKLIAPYMIKEWTRKDEMGNAQQYLGVDYGPMQFVLINAIKEQEQIIEHQQKIAEQQQKELMEYKTMMLELLKRVDSLEKTK